MWTFELYVLYCSPNIILAIKSRRIIWAGHVARIGERRDTYRVLVGRPKGKKPLRRPVLGYVNIKMEL